MPTRCENCRPPVTLEAETRWIDEYRGEPVKKCPRCETDFVVCRRCNTVLGSKYADPDIHKVEDCITTLAARVAALEDAPR